MGGTNDINAWLQKSEQYFGRNLMDKYHGIKELRAPIPNTENPHVLIERANSSDPQYLKEIKFENTADIKIVREGTTIKGYKKLTDGTYQQISLSYTSGGKTYTVYDENGFFNFRENKYVRSLDIDIAKLRASGIDLGKGLIYVSEEPGTALCKKTDSKGNIVTTQQTGAQAGVRIVNGTQLPTTVTGAFSLASDDPVYVQGNYNTVNTIVSLIAGDAINILSNAWVDKNSFIFDGISKSDSTKRIPTATTTNSVFLTGNVPSASNQYYSGGAENYFRYQEKWTNVTHTFRGSLLNLFSSQTATGKWQGGTSNNVYYYDAPTRNWGWDTTRLTTLNPPPGMINIFLMTLSDWEQVS